MLFYTFFALNTRFYLKKSGHNLSPSMSVVYTKPFIIAYKCYKLYFDQLFNSLYVQLFRFEKKIICINNIHLYIKKLHY